MRKTKVVAIIVALLVGMSPAQGATNLNQDFTYMIDLRKALATYGVKCAYTRTPEVMMVREAGTCKWRGKELTLELYSSTEMVNEINKVFGNLSAGWTISKANWMIYTTDAKTAKAISKLLKIKVK